MSTKGQSYGDNYIIQSIFTVAASFQGISRRLQWAFSESFSIRRIRRGAVGGNSAVNVLAVHLYICTDVQMYSCPSIRMYSCPSVQLYICTSVQLYICTAVHLYSYTDVQLYFRDAISRKDGQAYWFQCRFQIICYKQLVWLKLQWKFTSQKYTTTMICDFCCKILF